MTWIAPQLKERIQIRKPIRNRMSDGSTDRGYETILTIWGAIKPLNIRGVGQTAYIRGEQEKHTLTHEFIFRRTALSILGTAYDTGFDTGFDTIADLNVLKADYFLFVQRTSTVKGKLYRVKRIADVKERRELIKAEAEEVEELGTGYPI